MQISRYLINYNFKMSYLNAIFYLQMNISEKITSYEIIYSLGFLNLLPELWWMYSRFNLTTLIVNLNQSVEYLTETSYHPTR